MSDTPPKSCWDCAATATWIATMVTVGRGTTDYRYCDEHAYSLSWWALHNNDPSFDGPEGMLTSVTFTAIPAE